MDNVDKKERHELCHFPGSKKGGKQWILEEIGVELCQLSYAQQNPQVWKAKNVYKPVDNVDNWMHVCKNQGFFDVYKFF